MYDSKYIIYSVDNVNITNAFNSLKAKEFMRETVVFTVKLVIRHWQQVKWFYVRIIVSTIIICCYFIYFVYCVNYYRLLFFFYVWYVIHCRRSAKIIDKKCKKKKYWQKFMYYTMLKRNKIFFFFIKCLIIWCFYSFIKLIDKTYINL